MCLVGTGSSGIASGQVSPALGERELMTHLFCLLSPGETLNAACVSLGNPPCVRGFRGPGKAMKSSGIFGGEIGFLNFIVIILELDWWRNGRVSFWVTLVA